MSGVGALDIIRITAHPSDPNIVLLHVPYNRNELMSRYEPAQLSLELHAFLLHVDHLESFERFADYVGLYLLDERRRTRREAAQGELCFVCKKPREVCQEAAGNRGPLRDHDFVSTVVAELTIPLASASAWAKQNGRPPLEEDRPQQSDEGTSGDSVAAGTDRAAG